MRAYIQGIGAFGPGFANWQDLAAIVAGEPAKSDLPKAPKPAVIPANERRRAPLAVRIAVETSSQAMAASEISPAAAACVFTSGHGDTDLTDYMCRQLAGEHKQLSPTKFHNSVHNAAAGYWTIATGCQQPANSVAGMDNSVAITLMEAMTQCVCQQQPVLLAFYDTPTAATLASLLPNDTAFGMAILLTPDDDSGTATRLDCTVTGNTCPWPETQLPAALDNLYRTNPAARSLVLANAFEQISASTLALPLGRASALEVNVTPARALLANNEFSQG